MWIVRVIRVIRRRKKKVLSRKKKCLKELLDLKTSFQRDILRVVGEDSNLTKLKEIKDSYLNRLIKLREQNSKYISSTTYSYVVLHIIETYYKILEIMEKK